MNDEPWEKEPDFVAGSYGDVPYFIVRTQSGLGHLCGYIAVNENHPWWGRTDSWTEPSPINNINVHGGVTWAGWRPGGKDSVLPELHNAWFIGFDCAHAGDLVPYIGPISTAFGIEETYKTVDYVRAECEKLAKQAIDAISHRMLKP